MSTPRRSFSLKGEPDHDHDSDSWHEIPSPGLSDTSIPSSPLSLPTSANPLYAELRRIREEQERTRMENELKEAQIALANEKTRASTLAKQLEEAESKASKAEEEAANARRGRMEAENKANEAKMEEEKERRERIDHDKKAAEMKEVMKIDGLGAIIATIGVGTKLLGLTNLALVATGIVVMIAGEAYYYYEDGRKGVFLTAGSYLMKELPEEIYSYVKTLFKTRNHDHQH